MYREVSCKNRNEIMLSKNTYLWELKSTRESHCKSSTTSRLRVTNEGEDEHAKHKWGKWNVQKTWKCKIIMLAEINSYRTWKLSQRFNSKSVPYEHTDTYFLVLALLLLLSFRWYTESVLHNAIGRWGETLWVREDIIEANDVCMDTKSVWYSLRGGEIWDNNESIGQKEMSQWKNHIRISAYKMDREERNNVE